MVEEISISHLFCFSQDEKLSLKLQNTTGKFLSVTLNVDFILFPSLG